MGIFDYFFSRVKTSLGYQQTFEQLVEAGNIPAALSLMSCDNVQQTEAIKQYELAQHAIMQRQDKAVFDANGNFKGWVKRWKLPLSYPKYINEIALAFLYGRPLLWNQDSEGTDNAFALYQEWINDRHFMSKWRMCKLLAGKETKAALLFHCYQNKEGKADCLIKVLAKSLGDDIYYMKDQFDRLVYFARGYWLKDTGNNSVYHVDIYTDDWVYECKRQAVGWDIQKVRNFIGKKPVILMEQETEWDGAERLMERQEHLKSRTADVNDYFADPALVATADVVKGMPDKDSENKLYVLSEKGKLEYLTPDGASELKQNEMDDNEKHIFRETFTPNIDFEIMRTLSNVSGKALKQMMLLAEIKANKRKDTHDEYLTRAFSLIKAIMGNVTNIEQHAEIEKLKASHEYQEPFGEDIAEVIANAVKEVNAGGMSKETLIEQNPLVRNKEREKLRIAEEERIKEEKQAAQAQNVFAYE